MQTIATTDLLTAMVVDVPEGSHGRAVVSRFEVRENDFGNLRLAIREGRSTPAGVYTKLTVNGRLWMSDTQAERRDHLAPLREIYLRKARRILVNGLGLGLVIKAALTFDHVEHIDVVERDLDVAALVGPHYEATGRVTVHVADAYEQARRWPRGTTWDVGWSDIWPDLCADYLPDMARLNRSYGRRCGWHECWGRNLIRHHVRRHGW